MEIVQAVSDADRLLNNLLNPAFLTHRSTISTNHMKEAIMSPIRCQRSDEHVYSIQEFEETEQRNKQSKVW